jgi:hypothetical protein
MTKIADIQEQLKEYQNNALEEYSKLEKLRHKHFKHKIYSETLKRDIIIDGGHPDSISHWIKILKEIIFLNNANTRKKHFKDIFKRTDLDPTYYRGLDIDYKEAYETLLLKTEAQILQKDFSRTEARFNPEQNNQTTPQQTKHEEKYYQKTALSLFDEYMEIKKRETINIDKDEQGIKILLSATDKKYLIDFAKEDFDKFVDILVHIPRNVGKSKEIFLQFNHDYQQISTYCKEYGFEKQSQSNGWSKFSKVRTFLNFAIEEGYLAKNLLLSRRFNKKYIENFFRSGAIGMPFNTTELNKLFNQSSWLNEKNTIKTIRKKPERYFYNALNI